MKQEGWFRKLENLEIWLGNLETACNLIFVSSEGCIGSCFLITKWKFIGGKLVWDENGDEEQESQGPQMCTGGQEVGRRTSQGQGNTNSRSHHSPMRSF